MEAVQAAVFIPEDKTAQLFAKIAVLGGSHQAELLQGNVPRFNARKHANHSTFYNVQAAAKQRAAQEKAAAAARQESIPA